MYIDLRLKCFFFTQDGALSQDEIENHVDLFIDAANEQQSEQKAKDVKDEL